jgi:hypothetical protein
LDDAICNVFGILALIVSKLVDKKRRGATIIPLYAKFSFETELAMCAKDIARECWSIIYL